MGQGHLAVVPGQDRSQRLHGLSPPDLPPIGCRERVQGHVLGLEGRDPNALAPQQPAQPGPAGHAENQAKDQQFGVGSLLHGLEQFGVLVHENLQHQHRGRDEQDAGNGIERGVDVLDDIVDPAAQVPGHNAEQQRERQHHHRRQGTDHQSGADALQRLVENVLPHLVRAEHVIFH